MCNVNKFCCTRDILKNDKITINGKTIKLNDFIFAIFVDHFVIVLYVDVAMCATRVIFKIVRFVIYVVVTICDVCMMLKLLLC